MPDASVVPPVFESMAANAAGEYYDSRERSPRRRGAQRADMEVSALGTPAVTNDMNELLEKCFQGKLPPYVFSQIQELHQKFASNVASLLQLRDKNAKLKEDIATLKSGAIPAGCRQYVPKKGYVGQQFLNEDVQCSFILRKGQTIDDCKRVIFVTNLLFNRLVDDQAH